jgi:hypothetical protein
MPSYQKADSATYALAQGLIEKYDDHADLITAKAKIDLVFAFGDLDDDTHLISHAIMKGGIRALGLAKKIGAKDRAMGRGDAEIILDADYWQTCGDAKRLALLDHELHHLAIKKDKYGVFKVDDQMRPQIKMRMHDYDLGWFNVIAQRHGDASIEVIQAKQIVDEAGQYYFPQLIS